MSLDELKEVDDITGTEVPKERKIVTAEQLQQLGETENLELELPTLEKILGPGEWVVKLKVKTALPYAITASAEKESMKVDGKSGEVVLDYEKFILRIWDELVKGCEPKEMSPQFLKTVDSTTTGAILLFLYRWYRKRFTEKEIDSYKKK